MRAMPKKSRNPFLSEKYVEIPAGLGGPALEGGGTLCVGGAVRCGAVRAGAGRERWRSAARSAPGPAGLRGPRGGSGRRRVGFVLASFPPRGTFRSGQSSALGLKVRGS